MKKIKKALTNYVNNKGPEVKQNLLFESAKKDSKALIDFHFQLISQEIDNLEKSPSENKIIVLLKNINTILANCEDIDRGIIKRGIEKTVEKLDRLRVENKSLLNNKVIKKLDKLDNYLENLHDTNTSKESNPYDLVMFLIKETRNVSQIEYAFKKIPNIVNTKSKNQVSLLRTVIRDYFESLISHDENNLYYYNSIISLILSEDKFKLTTNEKNKIVQEIYDFINKISINKKDCKKNKEKIQWLNNVVNIVKGIKDVEKDVESISIKYDVPISFDEKVKEAAKMAKIPTDNEEERYYVDDYIISIDGPRAVEIDDAVSCRKLENGNYLLGVHIASVLSYFTYESDVVQNALKRVRSIYLDKNFQSEDGEYSRLIPTLPYSFSAITGSLIMNTPKYARSYYFEISKQGEIVNEKFYKSIIKNNNKTSYEEIDKILNNGTDNEQLQRTVSSLQEVCEILDNKYNQSQLHTKVKENSKASSELKLNRHGAEKIVNLSMLLTGNRVAEYFANSKEGYPCLYRVHEIDDANNKKLESLIEDLSKTYGGDQYRKLYQLISGVYPKGHYALEGSHSGLNLKHYCHCTSGLRRSADIIVEHALNVCYDNNPKDQQIRELEKEIKTKCEEINARDPKIDWFARDYAMIYKKKR